jgi:hypothetical protein
MKLQVLATVVLAGTLGVAHADNVCNAEIEKTKADWQALQLQPASKPSGISHGIKGHEHIQSAVDSMRFHMAEATKLCREGNDHEALLHLDVVRAFLKLPEIQHPTDHRYLFKGS